MSIGSGLMPATRWGGSLILAPAQRRYPSENQPLWGVRALGGVEKPEPRDDYQAAVNGRHAVRIDPQIVVERRSTRAAVRNERPGCAAKYIQRSCPSPQVDGGRPGDRAIVHRNRDIPRPASDDRGAAVDHNMIHRDDVVATAEDDGDVAVHREIGHDSNDFGLT